MKKISVKMLAVVLGILFLSPLLLPFSAFAIDADTDCRFIFDVTEQDGWRLEDDGSVIVQPLGKKIVFNTTVTTPMGSGNSTNALYLILENQTDAAVTLTVEYVCNDKNQQHTVTYTFAPNQIKSAEWRYAPHIASLREGDAFKLTLSFDGTVAADDAVVLHALYDVSVYDPSEEEDTSNVSAEIERCYYEAGENEGEGFIHFSGSIYNNYEDEDSTLALFAFGPDDQDFFNVITKTPVARMSYSKTFSFRIAANSAEEVYAKYAVAVVTKSGERKLLCQPIYPDVASEKPSVDQNFKGFHTQSLHTVLDSGVGVEIVDVYLDRLLVPSSDSGDSILYAGAHSYYFFSEAEISALDRRIQNLTGHGIKVYLRFLVSGDATGHSFVNQADSSVGIVNKGVDIKSEAALLEVHALTDFLTARYSGAELGCISGIILGRAADRSSVYGYLGLQKLSVYAERYATYLNLVAGVARTNIRNLDIIVPISDRVHSDTIRISDLTGDYFSDLFLDSLLLAMEDLILTPPDISVMLEAYEGDEAKAPDDVGNVQDFLSLVQTCAQNRDFLSQKIFYAWYPSSQYSFEEINAAYAIRYATFFFKEQIQSFIVDLSLHKAPDDAEASLRRLVSTIDTSVGAQMLENVRRAYPEAFRDCNINELVTKITENTTATQGGYANGAAIAGSYTLFDFSRTSGKTDWYAGNLCESLAIVNGELTAYFKPTYGEQYAGIAYSFAGGKNYSIAPMMRFSLGIKQSNANSGTPYEVQIRFVGEDRTVIASAVVEPGSAQELYVDLSNYTTTLEKLGSIRILARPLNGSDTDYELYVNRVILESQTLGSAELAEQIAIQVSDPQAPAPPAEQVDYTKPILISAILIFVSFLLVFVIVFKHVHKRRHKI